MMYRCAHIQYLTIRVFALLIISTSVNADSFRDFILGEESSAAVQRVVKIPENSELASCVQCHDGKNAKAVRIKHADTAMTFTSRGSSNHPIGMSYNSYARKDPVSYVAPDGLDSRIKLENGKVTCVSCHESKQTNTHKANIALLNKPEVAADTCTSSKTLTTGPDRSRLCLSCHIM